MGFESVKYGSVSFDEGFDAVRGGFGNRPGWVRTPSKVGRDTVQIVCFYTLKFQIGSSTFSPWDRLLLHSKNSDRIVRFQPLRSSAFAQDRLLWPKDRLLFLKRSSALTERSSAFWGIVCFDPRIVCFHPGSSAFILLRIVCFHPWGSSAFNRTRVPWLIIYLFDFASFGSLPS